MNKKIVILIIAINIGIHPLFQKTALSGHPPGRCGDDICDVFEKHNPYLCPQDCREMTSYTESQDSPFGIFAAFAQEFPYFKKRMDFTNDDYWGWTEDHIRNLGAHWTRSNVQLIWDFIEPEIGIGYNWNNSRMLTDRTIKRMYLPGNNVHWVGVFHEGGAHRPPPGAESKKRPSLRNPLDYPEEYKTFVKTVVERYDGDDINDASPRVHIKYWQAGNELPGWAGSIQDYVKFVRLIKEAVKEADPQAKVVLIASISGLVKSNSMDPAYVQIIEALADEKGFDAIDIHHWGKAQNYKIEAVPQYRQLLDSRGLNHVEIFSMEHSTWQGQPTGDPSGDQFQTEKDQAVSLIKRYAYNLAHGLDKLFWNNLIEWHNFEGNTKSPFNSMGLISDGQGPGEDPAMFNVPRLAYYTYKKMTETLEGSDWNNIQTIQESDGVYVYKFTKAGKPIWVAWNDNSVSKTITISGISSGSVKITEAVPKYESGKDVADYSTAFNMETKQVQSGKISIMLGDMPVFIKERGLSKPRVNKLCGDGVCDELEKVHPDLCPGDCKKADTGFVTRNIKVSSPIVPFENNGDLWFSTWADDDSVFVSWGDGFGPNLQERPPYSHHGLAKLNGTFPYVTAGIVNNFMPLADEKNNSKPSSLLFYDGRLYAAIHSPLLHPNVGFIAYSDDYGRTFKYDTNSPWTKQKNSNFVSRMFINMGKDYDLNKDGYIYAFGIGSEIEWNGKIYLSRVAKNNILDYNAWEYFSGLSADGNPEWSKNQFNAAPVSGIYSNVLFSSIYHPGIKKYIILTATFHKGELFEAPNPWGPWKLTGKWFDDSSEWFSSYMPGIIPKDLGEDSFYFAVAGRELGKDGGPNDKKYRFRLGKITMVMDKSSAQEQ